MGITRLTERDVIPAARSHYLLKLTRPAMATFLVLFPSFMILAILFPSSGTWDGMSMFLSCALVFWLGSLVYSYVFGVPRAARKQVRELASYRGDLDYQWSADRFSARGETGYSEMAWKDLHAWHRYPGGYMLYPSSGMYFIVPDRVLDEAADERVMKDAVLVASVAEYRYFRRMR